MSNSKLSVGDICKLKGNDYITLKINKILPKGSHGRGCILAECLVSAGSYPVNFDGMCLIQTYRLIDLKKV